MTSLNKNCTHFHSPQTKPCIKARVSRPNNGYIKGLREREDKTADIIVQGGGEGKV